MTHDLKLFVSFSSRDQDVVRMLFSSLAVQHVGVWDYSRGGEQLPLAQPVEESLARKISLCDYFLAVVSASSTDELLGRYTEFEVRKAIENGLAERHRLLPLLLVTSPPLAWRSAYKEIEELLRVELNPSNQKQFDAAVQRICGYMSVPYVPPILSDPRVFFSHRFQQEMNSQEVSPADYVDLMNIIISTAENVAHKEWEEAERLVSLFLALSAIKLPDVRFYYPQIIKGVCELQSGHFETAERTFAQATKHPLCDENSYGGLGHAYFYQHRYDEALAAFKKALEIQPTDKRIQFNIGGVLQHTFSANGDSFYDNLASAELSAEDRTKVDKMIGISLIRRGNYEDAVKVFELIGGRGELDAASVIYFSRALESCGRVDEAVSLLYRHSARLMDLNLYHHLADAQLRAGMIREALSVYEQVLCRPDCRSRQYLVEYARILNSVGGIKNEVKMREVCRQVVDQERFGDSLPTAEDFYYMGFANYLLRNNQLARYDYERSGRLFKYYNEFA